MPHPIDPYAYGELYHKLSELLPRVGELSLVFAPKEAQRIRHKWYSFVHSWRKQAERQARQKALFGDRTQGLAGEHYDMYVMLRVYSVFLEDIDEKTTKVRWINMSMTKTQQDGLAQLAELEAQLPPAPAAEPAGTNQAWANPQEGVVDEWLSMAGYDPLDKSTPPAPTGQITPDNPPIPADMPDPAHPPDPAHFLKMLDAARDDEKRAAAAAAKQSKNKS